MKTWTAQANEAVILQRQNIIMLTGDVILKQVASGQQEPLLLTAKQLTIEPDKRQASTISTIKLVKGQNQIEANGMHADLNKNRIEFLSDTRSHYVLPAK
jgi:LPS export ABC transporter protein LptC